eukprot:jgi/Botrbrau1/19114/Bobra.0077s0027.1
MFSQLATVSGRSACLRKFPLPGAHNASSRIYLPGRVLVSPRSNGITQATALEELLQLAQEQLDSKVPETEGLLWDGGGFEDEDDDPGMTTAEVKAILATLCGEDVDCAQLEMQAGNLELRVMRGSNDAADDEGSGRAPASMPTVEEEEIPTKKVLAKQVGIFYRSRTSKKKPDSKAVVEVGEIVTKGQALAFLEQVGHLNTVKAEEGGEVVAFLVDNGVPVQYGQPIVEIRPSRV